MWLQQQTQRVGRGSAARLRKTDSGLQITYCAAGSVYALDAGVVSLHRFLCLGEEAAFASGGKLLVRENGMLSVK